ncbi:hypothetical protein BN2476_1240007 [Paraburkholderia piptadeniae]|uniref:Uncharacterized protein n=1 Tax=Paraburkholderia piptadeniae TaxID=1701573 RepID=A0A1N7SVP5_9BURK|nr:hypothetical protein BN2476_1240007 [Paraburkholderia piptadeniae]
MPSAVRRHADTRARRQNHYGEGGRPWRRSSIVDECYHGYVIRNPCGTLPLSAVVRGTGT